MDIRIYTNRIKHSTLPTNFNHQAGESYASSYEYTKTFSNYHFDKYKVETEGDWYHKLGRFVGKWNDEVAAIIEHSKQMSWDEGSKNGARRGFPGGISPMKAQEDYDRVVRGLGNVDQTQLVLNEFLDQCPKIKQIINYWGLGKMVYRVHCQWPGQAFGIHIDKLWHFHPVDPAKVIRIMVHLTDYEPGQLLIYGNSILTQWRSGDVHTFDHYNTPHGTINLSTTPRPMLVISGIRTIDTDCKLAQATNDSVYVI